MGRAHEDSHFLQESGLAILGSTHPMLESAYQVLPKNILLDFNKISSVD